MRSFANPYISSNRPFDRSVRAARRTANIVLLSWCGEVLKVWGYAERSFLLYPIWPILLARESWALPPPPHHQPIMSMFNAQEERGESISLGTARLCQTAAVNYFLCCFLASVSAAVSCTVKLYSEVNWFCSDTTSKHRGLFALEHHSNGFRCRLKALLAEIKVINWCYTPRT